MAGEGGAFVTDLFLSYKAEDRARVAPLVQALETDGLSVWWDAHIGGGDDWRETILRHLESAKCVVVMWSRRSAGSKGEFVRDEASRAKRRGVYFPVQIDRVELPLGFGETQALDLIGWKGDRSDPRYQTILSALRKRLGIRPKQLASAQSHAGDTTRRNVLIGAGVAATASLAGAGAWLLSRSGSAHSDSIAVQPFANLSGDSKQDYFSDGIAEELRGALARVAGLKVVGRTSSEALRNEDAETVSKRLGVPNILTGSVRQSASTIRISAQLVDGRTGIERWSENYDRAPGDAIKIQTDIAENVARALSIALARTTRAAIAEGGTANVAAQKLLLQAIALAQGRGRTNLQSALTLVDGALALDANYGEAYVQKASFLNAFASFHANAEELPRYRAEAMRFVQKALQISPKLASAHNVLGDIYRVALKLHAADAEYRRALSLAPGDAETMRDYATFISKLGRKVQSLQLSAEAISLDPLNRQSYAARFDVLTANRSFSEALRFAEETRRKSAEMFPRTADVAFSLIQLGRDKDAAEYLRQIPPDDADRVLCEAVLFARARNWPPALAKLQHLMSEFGDAASYQYAQLYAQAGDKDRAFAALERAWAVRDSGLTWLKVDPLLDPLRDDARFASILERIDFPT